MNETRLLGSTSPFSVSSLESRAEETLGILLDRMSKAGHGRHLSATKAEVRAMLSEVGRWIGRNGRDDDQRLRASYRALALRLRGRSVPVEEVLEELEQLENALFGAPVGTGDGGGDDAAGIRLRRALRILWTEIFQVNHVLDRRRDRDRIDVVERFGEIISHELGNRLGAAQTGVLLLHQRADLEPHRRAEVLELIADGIAAALETVDDVTALTALHEMEDDEHKPFRAVAVQVARGLSPFARSRSVRIDIEPSELPDVDVDAGRVRLVISNFMMNAVRYADDTEGHCFVHLTGGTEDGDLWFAVSDNGVGVDDDAQSRIFEFEVRGRNHRAEGSGMGLAIAAEAVDQLGGDIQLESTLGKGSTFRVRIPLTEPEESSDGVPVHSGAS
ncbi:MAG TPA: HAMP domain-containing sensor histidine kinase [Longimicrobiales bacterium]|nr:HAMP domain-containing sensor histidine kinase [Longimicrobiales bacterium]